MKKVLKVILIIIGVLFLAFAGLVAYIVVDTMKQEEILEQEVLTLTNKDLLKDNYYIEIKTKGEYAYVEQAIKKFYKELSDNVKEFNTHINNKDLVNILSVDNLKSDRKGFIKSRKTLSDAKEKIVGSINNISSLCDEETIKNLIDKEKVSDSTIEFYKKIMYTEKDLKELKDTKEQLEKTANSFNKFLDKIKEILDLLDKNDSSWFIEDNQLYFTTNELVDEYNKLYKELTVMAEEDFKVDTSTKSSSSSSI